MRSFPNMHAGNREVICLQSFQQMLPWKGKAAAHLGNQTFRENRVAAWEK